MKTYNIAKLQIVRTDSDILTTSLGVGNTVVSNSNDIQSPARRSIWD